MENNERNDAAIRLSYDRILKSTLALNQKVAVSFFNAIFNENYPPDTKIEWLDKEFTGGAGEAYIADFYPRLNSNMYLIEIEQDSFDNDMALRVFRYSSGGAMLHSTKTEKGSVDITYPTPVVIYLKNTKNTPKELKWYLHYHDGTSKELTVPTIRLFDLSVKEIIDRKLLIIGQFYLRKYDKVTARNIRSLSRDLKELVDGIHEETRIGELPKELQYMMINTIDQIVKRIVANTNKEMDIKMVTNIQDTLLFIDYQELFLKHEAIGKAEGKAENQMEIALNAFKCDNSNLSYDEIVDFLCRIGIPEDIVIEAYNQSVQ